MEPNDQNKPVSLREVAALAGVSPSTASRVINNSGRISPATRARVQRVVEETGYVANMAAKSLREAHTCTIGMIVPDISGDFFSALALHTEQYLDAHGYSVLVCSSDNSVEREAVQIKTFVSKQVDGIICLSGASAYPREAEGLGTPIVYVDRRVEEAPNIPHVNSDDMQAGYLMGEHLASCGCRHIAVITWAEEFFGLQAREAGLIRALAAHGINVPPAYRLYLPPNVPSRQGAEDLIEDFLGTGLPLDGIFARSDRAASGVLHRLQKLGVDVPGQVKLAGYDGSVYSAVTIPGITTIDRHADQLAAEGCKALLALIEGKEPPHETIVPVELVVRGSTVAGRG